MKNIIILILISIFFMTGCSSPEEKAQAYFQSAQNLYDNKDYKKATLELKNALRINPKLAQGYYLSGLIAEHNKNWKAMYANMAKANTLAPKHVPTIVALGKFALLTGDYELANEKVVQAFALEPNSVDATILKSAILYKQYILDDKKDAQLSVQAIKTIEEALKLDPANLEAISLYVAMTLAEKNYEKILQVIKKGSVNEKNKKQLTILKIKVAAAQGNKAEVINLFGQLIFDEPAELSYRQALALYFVRLQDMEGAKRVLRDAVTSNPDSIDAKLILASFLAQQDLDEAAAELKKYTDAAPGDEQNKLRFALASVYQQKGDKAKAFDVYQNILDETLQDSDILLAKNSQALIAISDKDYNEAKKLIDDVLKKEPNNTDALFNRALISISNNEVEPAITDLRVVLRDKPGNEKALEVLTIAYLKIKKTELANEVLVELLDINPLHQKAASQYAFILLKKQDFEKVIQVLRPLERASKLDSRGYALLMQARLSMRDWKAAASQAQDSTSAKKEEYQSYIQALILQGKEEYEESSNILKTLLKDNPDFQAPLVALINNYDNQHNVSESIEYLLQFAQENPQNKVVNVLLAKQYQKNNESAKAIAVYQDLIEKNPEKVAYYQRIAAIYKTNNESDKVINVYKEALEKNKKSGFLNFQLASSYQNNQQYDKAIKQYELMFQQNPESKAVANNLASLLSLYQSDESLEQAYEIAKRFDKTEHPAFADTLGWIYYLKGDYDNALRLLKVSVQKVPKDAVFNYHLGKIYLKKNDMESAKKYIENSIKLGESKEKFSDYGNAQELLNQLM